ncbi:aminotransferase class III-fold pyridoxal phosphate-dependent enzyme [Streptomyces sp. DSM 42041]|uniref:Aminotransferase class III-fold pyridoxal phosphate-dependent enzyme n=1 Tax=Streptomyces hazeniae TaxID=3075538 RepID=A0ABU2NL55_9ACTN|nr:aminotransferase class III-fold pyridoxal phosphate-dependent enzyme [Streptomyces sp. DSM 42041]MDT0377720.1 aminotransferase class III-fold pyridoxal phosphate-dependent enzyme [Streptomyces sp. DSM 42041]
MNDTPSTAPTSPSGDELVALDRRHLLHPWTPHGVSEQLMIVAGQGCEVTDAHGRTYLDGRSGQFNATLGYGNKRVLDALSEQAGKLMTYALLGASNEPAVLLGARLAELLGEPLTRTLFCNSGSESTEAALRIVRMYHAISGRPERTTIISLADCYHGTTTAATAMMANPMAWTGCGPRPEGFVQIPSPTRCGACAAGAEHEECVVPGPEALEEAILAAGADTVAAFFVEPVLGVGGIRPLPDGYLRAVREICDRHGVLLVLDEVTTGLGRTGAWFAHQREGITPDLVTMAKGLTSGYAPLAAVTMTERIADVFATDPMLGGLRHGHTTSGHGLGTAVALSVLRVIEEDGLVENAAAMGDRLQSGLREQIGSLDGVRDVRGLGLMVGVEFDSMARGFEVQAACAAAGVIVRCEGTVLSVAPPLIVTAEQVDRIVGALRDAVAASTGEFPGV